MKLGSRRRIAVLIGALGCGVTALGACSDTPGAAGTTGTGKPGTAAARPVPGGGGAVVRVARERCDRLGPIDVERVVANPLARRVGTVVFTPLALSRTYGLQPYDLPGAPDARAAKIGATVLAGGPTARVSVSATGGARLLYGAELTERLARGDLSWPELPRTVIFVRCPGAPGGTVATAFPGGLMLRRQHTCVRIRVTSASGQTAARSFPFGRGLCRVRG